MNLSKVFAKVMSTYRTT